MAIPMEVRVAVLDVRMDVLMDMQVAVWVAVLDVRMAVPMAVEMAVWVALAHQP